MNALPRIRTPEEEDLMIRNFLMPKPPPIAASGFDVRESTSPTPLAGAQDVPSIDDLLNFKLTMEDLPGMPPAIDPAVMGMGTKELMAHNFGAAPEAPVAPVAPPMAAPAPTPLPTPKAANAAPVPAPAPAVPPAQPTPAGPTDREKFMEDLKGDNWMKVVGQALAGMGDAQLAGAGGKGNFLSTATAAADAGRERSISEFDTAAKLKKETAEAQAKNDPTSPRSKAYQDLMAEYFPGKDFSKLSAAQIEEVIGPVGKMSEAREARKTREDTRNLQRESLKAERDRRYDERRQKDKTDIISKFNSDPGVRKIDTSIDAAANIRELATSGNPIAANAIPTYMARASGEVGNLSEADKRPFGGSQAIFARMEAALKQATSGQLTADNKKFILQLADTMEKRAMANKDRRAREVALQYSAASDFLDPNDLYDSLRPTSGGKPAGGGGGVKDVATEDEAAALPTGTRFRLADGRTGTVQ